MIRLCGHYLRLQNLRTRLIGKFAFCENAWSVSTDFVGNRRQAPRSSTVQTEGQSVCRSHLVEIEQHALYILGAAATDVPLDSMPLRFLRCLGVGIVFALLVGGCGSSEPMADSSAADEERTDAAARRAHALRTAAQQWRGTPHMWGGTSREGIDCSGLVQMVYQETLEHDLPRTTRAQSRVGTSVSSGLQPGDLVFFRVDTRKGRHVGIYLSDGEFLHASASDGVRISSLDTTYWRERWWQARRVLSDADSPRQSAVPSSPQAGW